MKPTPSKAAMLLFFGLAHVAALSDPITAARALIVRTAPKLAHSFKLELAPGNAESMQLDSDGHSIILRGSGAIELASAFHWYCNDYLNVTFDWNTYGAQQLPTSADALPMPATSAVVPRRLKWSYYMNVCTYGYSLAFVPWAYWETHIDWMAINGINVRALCEDSISTNLHHACSRRI